MKKIVTLFAALFSFAAVLADTETVDGVTYTYSISNGEATIVSEDYWSPAIPFSTSGELVVPSTLGGCPVMTIGSHAFYGCSSLTSVTIPEGVTTIGEEAFYICRSLTSVTIPESVTTIGGGAFMGTPFYDDQPNGFVIFGKVLYGYKGECLSLVTIPNGVMAIGGGAFRDCSSLTSVTIPESVTTIGSQAFYGCSSLAPVTIPESVTTIGSQSFEGCSSLTSVTIPSSVTTIGERAFACCEKLELVSIPSSVTEIGLNSFIGCRSLARVVVDIGDAQRMKDLMKDSGVDIDAIVFFDGSPLADGGPYTEKVNGVNYTYFISNGEAEIGTGGYSPAVPYTVSGALVIPTTLGACPVTKIGGFAFREREVTSVAIPSGVTIIGEHAFAFTSLTMVTIPSSVTTIGDWAFGGMCPLSEVWVEAGDEDRVKGLLADSRFDVSSTTFKVIPGQGSGSEDGELRIAFVVSDGEASLAEANYPTNGVYGRLPEARREGFAFAGWYTAFDGGTRVGAFSTINPEVTTLYARWVEQDASLYAQWAANAYTVNFNANGGSGAMAAQPFLYDQTQPLSANGFTKTGYTFKGWSTSPEGEVVFTDAAAVSNLTTEAGFTVALFAQWNKTVELDTDDISDWVAYDLADQYATKHGTNPRGYRDLFKSTFGNDYSAAFYKETGKVAADGTRLQVWHDYVAGTDPLDPESKFTASMTMVAGKPVISWTPELDAERAAMRKYTTYGKVKLTDSEWTIVEEGRASDYNFFKVSVEMK